MRLGQLVTMGFLAIGLNVAMPSFSQTDSIICGFNQTNSKNSQIYSPEIKTINHTTRFKDHYTAKLIYAEQLRFGDCEEEIKKFDEIVNTGLKNKITGPTNYRNVFQVMNQLEKVVKKVLPNYANSDFILESIKTGKADCDIYTNLYAAGAYQAGINATPVIIQGLVDKNVFLVEEKHCFLRIELSNGSFINWESTAGIFLSDESYFDNYNTPNTPIEDNPNFIVGEDEVLKLAHTNYFLKIKDLAPHSDLAAKYAELALEYNPTNYDVLLGATHNSFLRKDFDLSLERATLGTIFFPDSSVFYCFSGNSSLMKKKTDLESAKFFGDEMLFRFPDNPEGYFINATIYSIQGNNEMFEVLSQQGWMLKNIND